MLTFIARCKLLFFVIGVLWYWTLPVYAQETDTIATILLHPPVSDLFVCSEHGTAQELGDRFGRDCLVFGIYSHNEHDQHLPALFKGKGLENEDWFGWRAPLLAPCDGVVDSTLVNPVTNKPGSIPTPDVLRPAGKIIFRCDSGAHVIYAHVQNIAVVTGERIKAGRGVAEIGNNGYSRSPHVHIGAWRDQVPLQIRIDPRLIPNY